MKARPYLLFPLAALAAGCGTPGAVFVTKTSLAVADIDSTPAEMTVAMHRVEGFIAPRNQNGNTPPVLAHIRSNRDLWNPEVKQVYATGTAAERLAGDFHSNNSECEDCSDEHKLQREHKTVPRDGGARPEAGERQASAESKSDEPRDPEEKRVSPVVFTTSTTFGLRIGVSTDNLLEGIVLGYRRKEMSFVPSLARDKQGTYRYPSLIAAINLRTGWNEDSGEEAFAACQGFATGSAATSLAEAKEGSALGCLDGEQTVKDLLGVSHRAELRQQASITKALECYVKLPDERRNAARVNAEILGLVPSRDPGLIPTAAAVEPKTMHYAGEGYYAQHLVRAVRLPAQEEDDEVAPEITLHENLLRIHRDFVCAKEPQARKGQKLAQP